MSGQARSRAQNHSLPLDLRQRWSTLFRCRSRSFLVAQECAVARAFAAISRAPKLRRVSRHFPLGGIVVDAMAAQFLKVTSLMM